MVEMLTMDGKTVSETYEFDGNVNVTLDHQVPTAPTFATLGGEAVFKTTGLETLVLNVVNKTTPRKV
jgi:hypothetical protein